MVKRGSILVEAIIFLAISVMILLVFPSIGEAYGKRYAYKKEIAAKEMALMLNVLYSHPYDASINYDKDLTGFTIEISDNKVFVYSSNFASLNLDPTYRKYEFIPTGSNELKVKIENPKKIKVEKSGGEILVKKDEAVK